MKAGKLAAIAGAAVLAASALGTTTASAAPASVTHQVVAVSSHRSLPKVQTGGMFGGWHNGQWKVRPRVIYFGSFYGIYRVSWKSWNNSNAWGRGHLSACAGAGGPCQRGAVKIHLWNVHSHSGPGRYFKDLKYTGRYKQFIHVNGGVWVWGPYASLMSSRAQHRAGDLRNLRELAGSQGRAEEPGHGRGVRADQHAVDPLERDLRQGRWNRQVGKWCGGPDP